MYHGELKTFKWNLYEDYYRSANPSRESLLRWSADDLAAAAELGISTVRRAEAEKGSPAITTANLRTIQKVLEANGIEFIPENGGGVGVRFAHPSQKMD